MSSFLVFGGTGYIGRNLAVRLVREHPGCRIVLADLATGITVAPAEGVAVVPCDVRQSLTGQIRTEPFDCIYNLAAIHREPGHASHEYFDTNVQGAENVCAYAEAVGCRQIVFASSISVYGPTVAGTRETDGKYPTTPYGISKYIAEQIHLKWQASGPGRTLRIVRPGVVYGPADPGNILRMIKAVKRGYFVFPGDPATRKSFAYIEGLLDAIEFANALPDPVFTFNYVEKETLSIAELVAEIGRILGKRAPLLRLPRGAVVAAAQLIQWATRGKSPIHPVRVRKACTPTWVVPQALIGRGFNFRYDFASSLRDWKERAPADFQ